MKYIKNVENFLKKELIEEKSNSITAKNILDQILKKNKRFKWLKDELSKDFSKSELKDVLTKHGYGKEYDIAIKDLKVNESNNDDNDDDNDNDEIVNENKNFKINKTVLKLTFPCLCSFSDYHDIEDFEDKLNEIFDENIKSFEVGYSRPDYIGCFYVGKKPTKDEINELLRIEKIKLTDLDDN